MLLVLYRFREDIAAALARFDARNVRRIEDEQRDKSDPIAHFRHTLKVAEEQVEEVAEAAGDAADEAAQAVAEVAAAATETDAKFEGAYLMGTGSATGNYYNFGNSMCTVVNKATGANITVNATGGSTENARLLGSAKTNSR